MQVIPLQALASQVVSATLNGQDCRMAVRQLATGMYCDVYVGNVQLVAGVICQNINRIVRDAYLGFVGDLIFIDTEGANDPDYTGLGSRFVLCYLTPDEIAAEEAI